ncbi:MAG: ATP-binding protein, partial [bacterium]|nr:ATP-binding protein [bacterium]
VPALAEAAEHVKSLFEIDCIFECKEEMITLDHQCKINLYYIVQEAINNAIRHGKAKKITIRLGRHRKEILLSIIDNGLGFPKNIEKKGGMGLRIMKYRLSEIGAKMMIHRGYKKGTVITIRCPLV